jgi:anti-sigma factor RsiW
VSEPIPSECAPYAEEWSALLDGELASEREAELRTHLGTCARCQAKLASLARVDVLMAGLPVTEANADLYARLRARIDAHEAEEAGTARGPAPARRAPRRARGLAAAAVAAAAALALYLGLPRPRGETAPPPEIARDPEFDALPADELALGMDLDTAKDLPVIANLELLERLVALEEGRG